MHGTLPHTSPAPIPPSQAINSTAQLHACVRSDVPLESLLGLGAFSLERVMAEEPDFLTVGRGKEGRGTGRGGGGVAVYVLRSTRKR